MMSSKGVRRKVSNGSFQIFDTSHLKLDGASTLQSSRAELHRDIRCGESDFVTFSLK